MERIDLKELSRSQGDVFVSIYLPTHRAFPENQQDPIRFKNLLSQAEGILKDSHGMKDPSDFLAEAQKLQDDKKFWNHTADGLAVLINNDNTFVYNLEGLAPERVHVGNRFHLLPLMNYYEFLSPAYILDMSKDRFRLYHGDRESFETIDTPEVYQEFTELFDDKDQQSDLHATGGTASGFHGHSSPSQTEERETEKYYRHVANGLSEFLKDSSEPILLFGTTEVVADFNAIAEGRLNITKTVDRPLGIQNTSELAGTLKDALLPRYEKEVENRIEELKNAIGADRGSENSSRIMRDAETGRIQTLFISNQMGDLSIDEVDELMQHVINTDGEIIVVDEDRTDFDMGTGAIFRY